jgi:hypothetical protein
MKKILCGSSKLFKDQKDFMPADVDYILLTNSDKVFEHTHPEENVCYFIWGKDKELVKKYLLEFPYYLCAGSLITKEFVEHYEFTHDEVVRSIERYYDIYKTSTYRYCVPLFDYIKNKKSWDFPRSVLEESYKLYTTFKKR